MDSIEEVNRVRASLGLPLLPVPGGGPQFKPSKNADSFSDSESEEEQGSTLESRQALGYDNWKQLQSETKTKAQREANLEKIKKARDAAMKVKKLEGKGLGEPDGKDDLDAKTWLVQQKKRRRKLERERAVRLERELAEREEAAEYTEKDLEGVKVAHEVGDFEGGEEQVLTLKDSTIEQLEDEGDELENVELKETEALNERLGAKKKKPVYDPHAQHEEGSGTILQHYDETIDGKKRKRFTLDGHGASVEEREAMKQAVGEKLKAKPISLDFLKADAPVSDYVDATGAKIKKPKKKRMKTTRQKASDEDDIFPVETNAAPEANEDDMDIDVGATRPAAPKAADATSFADDDDLQASLTIQRKAALKKRKKTKPEDIARQLKEDVAGLGAKEDSKPEEGGMIIDETTEFVASFQRAHDERAQSPAMKPRSAYRTELSSEDEAADIDMDRSYTETEDLAAHARADTLDVIDNGIEAEAVLDQGVGAALSMLKQRGLLKPSGQSLAEIHRQRDLFLEKKRRREADFEALSRAQRQTDRSSSKFQHMSALQKEEFNRRENDFRATTESRKMQEMFAREYVPDVQLQYKDEHGRTLQPREAFKHLSHSFHGKGSSKKKTEKHLKKVEDEKKREAQNTLDASHATGMNNAMGATAKKNQQAGVRMQ
ncbi:hypothetical protein MMC21_006396 [Puttea exsequens]|nr:hypothetical protein [Puttea exsequens]